jgi:hypothetical protein
MGRSNGNHHVGADVNCERGCITDIPGILKSKTPDRTIDFCIEVVPDVGNKRVATARQTLGFTAQGQKAKYSFAVWINDASRPPD